MFTHWVIVIAVGSIQSFMDNYMSWLRDVEFIISLQFQMVVKFIRKSTVVSECWVDDPDLGRVSQEIAILFRLQHPNIVKVRSKNCL